MLEIPTRAAMRARHPVGAVKMVGLHDEWASQVGDILAPAGRAHLLAWEVQTRAFDLLPAGCGLERVYPENRLAALVTYRVVREGLVIASATVERHGLLPAGETSLRVAGPIGRFLPVDGDVALAQAVVLAMGAAHVKLHEDPAARQDQER